MVINRTFIGGYRAKGAWPCASSSMVIPNDQMSARELYLATERHTSLTPCTSCTMNLKEAAHRTKEARDQPTPLHSQTAHPCVCSMTSGAIQQGVPTKVLRATFLLPHEPPRSIVAATPKSASTTCPSVLIKMFPACAPQATDISRRP